MELIPIANTDPTLILFWVNIPAPIFITDVFAMPVITLDPAPITSPTK